MTPTFHVFVDGADDPSAAGLDRLAEAMATKYGLAAQELQQRLARGRVRVKANVDRATADTFVRELRAMGARCAVEAADAALRAQSPAVVPSSSSPTLPAARTAASSSSPSPQSPQSPQYQSGLAAAFSGQMPKASLGALEQADFGALSLASVDGGDDAAPAPPPTSFEPPAASASAGPPQDRAPSATPRTAKSGPVGKPKDVPLDLFAPPDAGEAEVRVDLAPEEVERAARKRASTPPPIEPVAAAEPSASSSAKLGARTQPLRLQSQPLATVAAPAPATGRLGPLASARTRLAVGVVLAIGVGFVPAHLVASMRERAAFQRIDDEVTVRQADATTLDAWQELDGFRARALDRKASDRRSIAIVSMLLWAVVGAGVGYVWFRRVPWDRLAER